MAPPYANTMFIIPLTFKNRGRLTNAEVCTGPGSRLKAAFAAAKFGGECATKPIEMKMMSKFIQTALKRMSKRPPYFSKTIKMAYELASHP